MKIFIIFIVVAGLIMPAIGAEIQRTHMGIGIEIVSPAGNTVFHQRNASLHCVATCCCSDRIGAYGWNWTWENGTKEVEYSLNFSDDFEFFINISLYPGKNSVTVYVISTQNIWATDNITVYYDGPLAMAGGPYEGRVGRELYFSGSVHGGTPPYRWDWDFGDGHHNEEQNPSHIYTETGTYQVSLTVTDAMGYTDTETTSASIKIRDDNSPTVKVISPEGGLYINGNRLIPFLMPVVLGAVPIEVTAHDNETSVAAVAFYADSQLRYNDTHSPYMWEFSDSPGRHVVQAKGYDDAGNMASDIVKIICVG